MQQFVNELQQLEQQLASMSQEMHAMTSKLASVTAGLHQSGSADVRGNGYVGAPTTRSNYVPTHSYGSQYVHGGATAQPYGANYIPQSQPTSKMPQASTTIPATSHAAASTPGSSYGNRYVGTSNAATSPMPGTINQGHPNHVNMSALQSILSSDGSTKAPTQTGRQSEHTSYGRVYY